MKVLSLMLLSLVSAMEYECGSINEPHFHHYRSNDFIGHFKIKNEKLTNLDIIFFFRSYGPTTCYDQLGKNRKCWHNELIFWRILMRF